MTGTRARAPRPAHNSEPTHSLCARGGIPIIDLHISRSPDIEAISGSEPRIARASSRRSHYTPCRPERSLPMIGRSLPSGPSCRRQTRTSGRTSRPHVSQNPPLICDCERGTTDNERRDSLVSMALPHRWLLGPPGTSVVEVSVASGVPAGRCHLNLMCVPSGWLHCADRDQLHPLTRGTT